MEFRKSSPNHRIEINRKATRVGTFEVCVSTHVSLRMFMMQVLVSQLPFLANRNAELAIPPLFWPVNCTKIGGHVALLSRPTVYTLYCALTVAWQTKSQKIFFGGEKGSDLTQRVRKFLYNRNGASKNTSYTALDESQLHEEDQDTISNSDHEKQGEVVIHSASVNRDKPTMESKCIYSKQ